MGAVKDFHHGIAVFYLEHKWINAALAVVGFAILANKLLGFLSFVIKVYLLNGTSLRKFGPKGSWAVITGATDGIGREFALQLAAKGFNIVLASRNEQKLAATASEIESTFAGSHIKTKTVAIDFSRPTEEDYARFAETVKSVGDVSILINSVGKSHEMPTPFVQTTKAEMESIVNINVMATLRVTQIVAPIMVSRKRGLIMTLASFASLAPTPLLATYAGSKGFLTTWSQALASELEPSGVAVELCQLYHVTGAMSKIRRSSFFIPTPKSFVRSALSKVQGWGGDGGYGVITTPHASHAVLHWLIELGTETLGFGKTIVNSTRGTMENTRRRALAKREREVKKST